MVKNDSIERPTWMREAGGENSEERPQHVRRGVHTRG